MTHVGPQLPPGARMTLLLGAMRATWEDNTAGAAELLGRAAPDVEEAWGLERIRLAAIAHRAGHGYEASGRLHEILDAQDQARS